MSRASIHGPEGAGYNSPFEEPRWYFDYAHHLMTIQRPNGRFHPIEMAGGISIFTILCTPRTRTLGRRRLCYLDGDTVCDFEDNCPNDSVPTKPMPTVTVLEMFVTAVDVPNTAAQARVDSDNDGRPNICDVSRTCKRYSGTPMAMVSEMHAIIVREF